MNLLLELRQVARACPKPEVVQTLRSAADELDIALSQLVREPTEENMRTVNGAWSHGLRVLKAAPPLGGDGTAGGAMPVPKYEEMRRAA